MGYDFILNLFHALFTQNVIVRRYIFNRKDNKIAIIIIIIFII